MSGKALAAGIFFAFAADRLNLSACYRRNKSPISRTRNSSGTISNRQPAIVAGISHPNAKTSPRLSQIVDQRTIVTSAARQRNGP